MTLRDEECAVEEGVISYAHDARAAVCVVDSGDDHPGRGELRRIRLVEAEAAVVLLDGVGGPIGRAEVVVDDADLHDLTDERAQQLVDDQRSEPRSAVLRVLRVADAERAAGELEHRVLEPCARAEKRSLPLARETDAGEG